MAGQKYNKAYEAYQQAVYRDGRNPTFWCSIGVLYFQINQYRDALDAYSRAIRINPYISEVWFDLGSLYESCNNQISDAIDAYARAAELDPHNPVVMQRLSLLRQAQATGAQLPAAPGPQDVHPTAYANAVGPSPVMPGPGPTVLQSSGNGNGEAPPSLMMYSSGSGSSRSIFTRSEYRDLTAAAEGMIPLSSPRSVGPYRGGAPPPIVLDESREPTVHTPLAPMEDRPHSDIHPRESGLISSITREQSGMRNTHAPLHGSSLFLQPHSQGLASYHEPQYSRDPSAYHSRLAVSPIESPPPSVSQPMPSQRSQHRSALEIHSHGSSHSISGIRSAPSSGQSLAQSPTNAYSPLLHEVPKSDISPSYFDRDRELGQGRKGEREWESRSSVDRVIRASQGLREGGSSQVKGYTSSSVQNSPMPAHSVYESHRGTISPMLSSTRDSPSISIPQPPKAQGGRGSDSLSSFLGRSHTESQNSILSVDVRAIEAPTPVPSRSSRYAQDIDLNGASPTIPTAQSVSVPSRRYDPRYDDQQIPAGYCFYLNCVFDATYHARFSYEG